MRKTLTMTLILAACLGLAACGKKGDVKPPASYQTDDK